MTEQISTTDQSENGRDPTSAIPLKPADVEEFRSLVEAETGVTLDTVTAWNRATELIALVRMLVAPMPEDPERITAGETEPSLPAGPE